MDGWMEVVMPLGHFVVLAATALGQAKAPEPIVLKGHSYVSHLAFHPKKKEIAVASQALEVHDLQTGVGRYLDDGGYQRLAYSPDGRWLAAIQISRGMLSTHGTTQVFDAQSGKKLFAFGGVAAWFTPDSRRLVTVGGYVHFQRSKPPAFAIHDLATGQSMAAEIHFNADGDAAVQPFAAESYVRFSRDGKSLVHGFQDLKEGAWHTVACDLATGKRVEPVTELAHLNDPHVSSDGALRLAGLSRGKAILLDARTGKEHASLELPAKSRPIRQLAFHPGGKEVIGLIESRQTARVVAWNSATGKQQRSIGELEGVHRSFALSADGVLTALADEAGVVRLIDVATGKEQGRLRDTGHHHRVSALAFSPDGDRFLTGDYRGHVIVWDFAKRRELFKLEAATYLSMMALHPNGKTAIGAVQDGIALWDLDTRRIVKRMGEGLYQKIVLSPDGKRLAAVHRDEHLTVWDLSKDQLLYQLKGDLGRSDGLAFSPDGDTLATAGTDGAVRLWDAANGKPLRTFREEPKDKFFRRRYVHVGFMGKDRLAALDDDGVVEVRDATTGEVLMGARYGRGRAYCVLHPSGGRVALGGSTGPIQEYDLTTGKVTHSMKPPAYLSSLTYDPSGRWLISGHDNGHVCLWPLAAP